MLRRWGASVTAAAIGGAVYGFSPALVTASAGHFQLQFAVLPPLIIHELLRILTGRGSAVRAGLWLGLLAAAQVYLGEELLADTAVAAAIIVAVLALSHPRASARAVRARGGAMAAGLGTAAAAAGVACGYALWVQFRGPLSEHGSPWTVIDFHSYLYGFVTPSGALAFHTAASAAVAASYPEPSPEYLAYLGWPLLAVAVVAAIAFWRDDRVRVAAMTFALLELFSLGNVPVSFLGIRYPAALLPWHWLAGNPVGANVLPDRFSILADGAVGALLAFALDRARGQAQSSGLHRVRAYAATLIAVLAVLPLVPLPLPVEAIPPRRAGRPPSPGSSSPPTLTCWSSPTCSTACSGRPRPACRPRWSAEAISSCPARAGRPPAIYMSGCGPPSTSLPCGRGTRQYGHRPRRRSARILPPGRWPRSSPPPAGTRPSRAS